MILRILHVFMAIVAIHIVFAVAVFLVRRNTISVTLHLLRVPLPNLQPLRLPLPNLQPLIFLLPNLPQLNLPLPNLPQLNLLLPNLPLPNLLPLNLPQLNLQLPPVPLLPSSLSLLSTPSCLLPVTAISLVTRRTRVNSLIRIPNGR